MESAADSSEVRVALVVEDSERSGESSFGGGGFNQRGGGLEGSNSFSNRGLGLQGLGTNRFSTPNPSQLSSFLGLPSDEGMHGLTTRNFSGENFDVNHGVVDGPRGGYAAGTTVAGPGGNTVGRGVAVGPNGGVAAGRGFEGAGGAAGYQGAAVGPGGRVAAGRAVRGPEGGAVARGIVTGPGGYAAGFARVAPSGRYLTAAGVRTNFGHYGIYGAGWYTSHPAAWYAAGWAAGTAWNAATWDSLGTYFGYDSYPPVSYDYGNNITYQDNDVYIDGQDAGTVQQYYDAAASLAATGTSADAKSDGNWMPLGVFALCKPNETKSDLAMQLAVNRDGVLRGNYTDAATNQTQLIHGSVDKKTQRVSFTVGDNKTNVIETGLYNLTKDEAPALIHFGTDAPSNGCLSDSNSCLLQARNHERQS